MTDEVTRMRRFERLSRLREFEVARHEPDPRGWTVVDAGDHEIGRVRDLIVDTGRMTGRYLDVRLEPKVFHVPEEDARIMVPMDRAHRVGDHHRVRVEGLTRESVPAIAVAREEEDLSFWDRWWARDTTRPGAAPARVERDDLGTRNLRDALEDVAPGETVRIPIVNEELVVERRPRHPDEVPPEARPVRPLTADEQVVARERARSDVPRRND
jgi:hypothetical protein